MDQCKPDISSCSCLFCVAPDKIIFIAPKSAKYQYHHLFNPVENYVLNSAASINEKILTTWKPQRPRLLQLLPQPIAIEVTAPIPDYPPMLFRYKNKLYKIIKADGPVRVEQEWWLQHRQHRDYYVVEDGNLYWLFRSEHCDTAKSYQ